MSKKKDAQLERIAKNEAILDEGTALVQRLEDAVEALKAFGPSLKALETYYTGKDWKRDSADDAAGLLPPELKRGVLSEDAVYDLLCDYDRLRKAFEEE